MGAPHCEQNIEIIPSYLERVTRIANDVFGIIITQCEFKYSKMTDLQGTRRQQAGSLNAFALVRTAETLADDLGTVDNRDKGTRIDLARVATQLHGLATA